MKRTVLWTCCTLALMGAPSALAQYHGGGHRNSGAVSGPTPDTRNDDLKDFERIVALQASPDQIVQFERLRASTREARRRAQELLLLPSAADKTDWISKAGPLSDAVVDAQDDNDKFLQSFSKEQREGLKKILKKLQRADSELTSGSKALDRSLHQNVAGGDQIPDIIERLDKALGDFQFQQLAIAPEMGIQTKQAAN